MEQAQQLYITDRILAKILLPIIPRRVTPNQITVIRFILTPFVIGLLYFHYYSIGFPLFILTALTDAIDGALARTRNQITQWGKIYDPVADKLLITLVMLTLMIQYINFYLVSAIIGLEIFIVIMGLLKKRQGRVIQANWWGKSKMILQCLGVGCLLVGILAQAPLLFSVATFILLGALIVGIISLFTYGL
jgi:CDP-diacylglycerol--glycerol-3-phosphate 3-phosphatidyltransferase